MIHYKIVTEGTFLGLMLTSWRVKCFWPPPYTIDLHDEGTFEISEDLDTKMDKIVEDEDEMIADKELSRLQFNKNPHKFVRLHQAVDGIEKNAEREDDLLNNSFNISEENFYKEYTDERITTNLSYSLKANPNVDYHNNMTKNFAISNIEEKRQVNESYTKYRRSEENTSDNADYNYEDMKRKFEEKIEEERRTEVKYTELKEYEDMEDSLKTIWRKKEEINCTIAEMKNINGKALLCLLKEPSKNKASKFFTRLGKILVIWFIVYVIIAVPMWCTRGWCCCCCRCKFCRPRNRIEWIKEYFMQNPVGVVHDDYGNRIEYHPTKYEKYYYSNLEKELKKLIIH
ncbi:uncharacterized protein LOC123306647 [Coccinella septempunctata]|uniref:uncharacterized protein LOC123306647 n=1 Tax=Coccinella septempunctata TaxID=41139 RepID=UPI001D0645D5|nr:uncharacterized protein LOC123306647 [Coccinella septempunctata]